MKPETKVFLEAYLLEKMKTLEKFVKDQNIIGVTIPDKCYSHPIALNRLHKTNLHIYWRDRLTNDEPYHIWISDFSNILIKFNLPEVLSEHNKIYHVFGFLFKELSENYFNINKKPESYSQIIDETFEYVEDFYK